MTRNLKALVLALVASLALSAAIASTASAEPAVFTAAVGAEVLVETIGEQIGTDTFVVAGLPAMTCTTVKEHSFPEEGGVHKKGPSAPNSTITPEYAGCHIVLLGITKPLTITLNGCTYTTTATKNTSGFAFSVDVSINCPENKQIELHVYNNAAHTETLCTFDIGPQAINNQIQLTNEGGSPDDVVGHMNATINAHNTKTGGVCGNSTEPTCVYKGTHTLRATNEAKAFVNTTIS